MSDTFVTPAESSDGWAHITLDPDAWYVRFYLWLYQANPETINTCKLFWAYLFAPLVLLLAGLCYPFKRLFAFVGAHLPERESKPIDWDELERKRQEREARASKREERLDKWSTKFGAVYARIAPALRWVGLVLGVLVGFAAAAGLIYLLVTYPVKVGEVILYFVISVAIAAVLLGGGFLLAEKSDFFQLLKKLAQSFHRHTCAKVDVKSTTN